LINEKIKGKNYNWQAGITSKSYLNKEEMASLCGLLADTSVLKDLLRKEDSLYQNYKIQKGTGLQKILSMPDWMSMMSRIEDQECGNCWAHAATGVTQGLIHSYYGSNVDVNLDEMQITYNSSCGNCNGTYWLPCGLDYIYTNKVRSEQGINQFPNYDHAYYTVSSYSENTASISAIKSSLQQSPVLAGMAVYEDFFDYSGGVYAHVSGRLYGNHAVVILGYDEELACWICRNSWGTGWGKAGGPWGEQGGYFRIGYGQCGIDAMGNVTASVTQDSCLAKMIPNFQTFQDAMTLSFVNDEWAYVLSSATINSGITVSVPSKAYIGFGTGKFLIVNGTLNASGTSANRVTFTRSGSSGTWGGILYQSGSSGSIQYANISNSTYGIYANSASPTINYVNVSNCTYGVRPYYSSLSLTNSTISNCTYGVYSYYGSPTMRYNTISSCTYGVYLNNSGSAVVSTNAISGCTRGIYGYYSGLSDFTDNYITSGGTSRVAGIQVYNATAPTIYNNTIEGSFTYGLDADHYSRPLAIGPGSQDYQGYNRIIGGQTATVYTHDHSESVLGTCFSSDGYAGYNTIYLDITTDKFAHIRAENYSNIIAQKNYWGDYPPSDFSADGTSSIDYSYPISSDPGGGSSLAKILGGLLADALYINIMPFDDAESVETLWRETTELWQSLQYRKALAGCDYILANYPDSPYAPLAFLRSVYAKRALKSTDMEEYLQKYIDTKSLRTMALELLIGEDLNNKRFEAAVEKSKTVIKENPDTEAEYKAMFGLFNLYATDLEDKENAQTVLDVMKGKYADYGLTQMAQFEMGETVDWQLAKPIAFQKDPEPEVVSILPDKFELKPNYPNPFNPTTNIAFTLPEESSVQIIIYDLTGREIWRSAKTGYAAGYYTISWNGVNQSGGSVVSGIYLVRMVTPKYTATQRIVLMK